MSDLIPETEVEELDLTAPVVKPRTFILHHRDCDGYAAGAIAFTSLAEESRTLEIKGVQYGEVFPIELDALLPTDRIFILDFSYKRDLLLDVYGRVEQLVVLDHHKSAEEDLQGLSFAKFDMNKSGALLAWEYFVPEYPASPQVIMLDCYDLWNKKHPDYTWDQIAAFQMACEAQEGNLQFWVKLISAYHIDPELSKLGEELYQKFKNSVKHVKEAISTEIVTIDGQKGVCFFCEEQVSLMSDALYNDPELDVTWSACFSERKGNWIVSLRSKNKDIFPVLPWAKKLGGGGHLASAGATLDSSENLEAPDVIPRFVRKLS